MLMIGERLRKIRESKKLSQGDIEKRTGLLRCYTSRVENGHTVPSIETLEKYAKALELPVYRFFYDSTKPQKKLKLPRTETAEWGATDKESAELYRLAKLLSQMKERQRTLLLRLAQGMASRTKATRTAAR